MNRDYILKQLAATGRKQVELARYLDLDPSVVNKILKGKRLIKSEEADKIRLFFNDTLTPSFDHSTIIELVEETQVRAPLIGNVQAGAFIEAFELETSECVPIFGELTKYQHPFGLRVLGDSMDKVYPSGSVLVCQQLSDYPRDLQSGNRVVIKRRAAGDLFEVTVKEYSTDGSAVILTPKSNNPKHKPQKIINGDIEHHSAGAPDLEIWAVVIGSMHSEV